MRGPFRRGPRRAHRLNLAPTTRLHVMKELSPLLALLFLLSACSRPAAHTSGPGVSPAPPPVNVTTSLAQERPMPRYLLITGELKAARQAMLAPDAPGKVVA